MEEEHQTEVAELRHQKIKRTLNELHDRATSILSFTLQWKDMDDHLDYTTKSIRHRTTELLSLKDSLKQRLELVEGKEKEIKQRETEFLEKQRKDIEVAEKSKREIEDVRGVVEQKLRELGEGEKRLEWLNKCLEERVSGVRVYEGKVERRERGVKAREEAVEKRCKELGVREKEVDVREKELSGVQVWCDGVLLKEKRLEDRCREIEVKEKEVELRCKEVELKERKLEEGFKEIEFKKEEVEKQCKEITSKERKLEEGFKKIELKENEVEMRCKEVVLKEKKLEEGWKGIELKAKEVETRCKEVELKEKKLDDRLEEIKLKERKVTERLNARVKTEPTDDNAVDYSAEASISFSVKMDGKALQIMLNERWRDHDLMRNEVEVALGLSLDPAKLVLDAMQGFYPPHLKKGDVEFEEGVVRSSCNLLLELLMKISPPIKPHVRKEAMKVAFDWITKLRKDDEHSLEVMGFLQLVGCYGLASAFDNDELLNYLEIVARHKQAPELLRVLGFVDKVSGIIQNLLGKRQQLEAIRFIYAFDLVSEFPPAPMLKAYLNNSKDSAIRIKRKDTSPEAQIGATNNLIDDVRIIMRCIEDYKIESELSLDSLKQQIDLLERENAGQKTLSSSHLNQQECLSLNLAAVASPALESASTTSLVLTSSPTTLSDAAPGPKTSSQQQSGNKPPWTAMTAEEDPNSVLDAFMFTSVNFPGQQPAASSASQGSCSIPFHLKNVQSPQADLPLESKEVSSSLDSEPKCSLVTIGVEDLRLLLSKRNDDLMRDKVSNALQHASDPAKLVLDVIKDPSPSNSEGNKVFKLGVSRVSCLFLLEQLRRVSPHIKIQVIDESLSFARLWKPKLVKKDRLDVICFLQLVAAYRLACFFDPHWLLGLLDTDHWRKWAPDLCQVLGLVIMIPDFIQDVIQREPGVMAVKYIYALDMVDKFPPGALLNDYLSCFAKKTDKQLFINRNNIRLQIEDIDIELKALKNVSKCVEEYKIESGFSHETLEERIMKLEKLKQEKSLILEKPKQEKTLILEKPETKIGQCTASNSKASKRKIEKKLNNFTKPKSESLEQNRKKYCNDPITAPAPVPNVQPQQQFGNKRPRITGSSDCPPKASFGATSIVHLMQPPKLLQQQPPGLFTDQGGQYINSSPRLYSLSGHPPDNIQSRPCYPGDDMLYYHWNTHGNAGYDRPMNAYVSCSEDMLQNAYGNAGHPVNAYGNVGHDMPANLYGNPDHDMSVRFRR